MRYHKQGKFLNSRSILPSYKPSVVILSPDALVVDRQHRRDLGIWQSSPLVCDGIINFAVFTDNRRGICSLLPVNDLLRVLK